MPFKYQYNFTAEHMYIFTHNLNHIKFWTEVFIVKDNQSLMHLNSFGLPFNNH